MFIALLPIPHPAGSGERGSCTRHIRMQGHRRRQRGSSSNTLRGSPSVRLSSNAWRCQKFWKEAIQQSQTYPPSPTTPAPWNTCVSSHCPPPKFTATVETTIARTSVPESSVAAGTGSPSKTSTPNTVPMLTPRPYSQPKNSQEVLKTFKVGRILWEKEDGNQTVGSLWTESLCQTKANTFMVDSSTHISGALICRYLRDGCSFQFCCSSWRAPWDRQVIRQARSVFWFDMMVSHRAA